MTKKSFISDLKHSIKKHPKEMSYLLLIYFFSSLQGMMIFLYLKKFNPSIFWMMCALVVPSIPACLFAEYSFRKIGYKKPILIAINAFLLLNSTLIVLTNLDFKFLPSFYNYIFILIFIISLYFNRNDSCSCHK